MLLGAAAGLLSAIGAIAHAHRQDHSDAKREQDEMQQFVIRTVREQYEDLQGSFNKLQRQKDQMELELNQQLALLTKENNHLKKSNEFYKAENARLGAENKKLKAHGLIGG
ncbi:hypothetical protein FD22_GL002142 [Loigolactobacillus coryniformis subsp. coryniformis KCTC 3167 = DSM 20001]|uniref:Uncharacterized protein n=1 Tax=Loigolactobacillus coryniformis subsp. coryniformis KCTC 3167 = DSM 20001 TaxID=913848 RepID=A0A0R1EZ40_9LACO|nr:hypothetical protein FD22_GL002142 [Loigolactobacillus coryniformis subsp. coryniformis KCTC 3167 = DSM 20001]